MKINPLSSFINTNFFACHCYPIEDQAATQEILKTVQSIFQTIVKFLNHTDLASLQNTIKENGSCYEIAWKALRKAEYLDFDWRLCQKEKLKNKWNYCLNRIFCIYLTEIEGCKDLVFIQTYKKVYTQINGVLSKFPQLNAYVKITLLQMHSLSLETFYAHELPEEQTYRDTIFEAARHGFGGESLLLSLFAIKSYHLSPSEDTLHLAVDYLKWAISRGATYASLIARQHFDTMLLMANSTWTLHERLAFTAAAKDDFRALALIIPHLDKTLISSSDLDQYPSVLAYLALQIRLRDKEEADQLYTRALVLYGKSAPAHVIEGAAFVKKLLGHLTEAELLYTRAYALYGPYPPADVVACVVILKYELNKYVEAEQIIDRALDEYGPLPPRDILDAGSWLKKQLKKWKESEALFDRMFKAYPQESSKIVLEDAAYVKMMLEKFEEADHLYDQTLQLYGDLPPLNVLDCKAWIKMRLEQWSAADLLYEKVFKLFEGQVSAKIIGDAAFVKSQLKKSLEANILIDKALPLFGSEIPIPFLQSAIKIKMELEKWEEVDGLNDKLLLALGEDASANDVVNAAEVKLALKKYAEANPLYAKAVALFGEDCSLDDLMNAAGLKIEFDEYTEATKYLDRALVLSDNNPSQELLDMINLVKDRLLHMA